MNRIFTWCKPLLATFALAAFQPAMAQITNPAPYCQFNPGLPMNGWNGAISKVTLGVLSNSTGYGNLAVYTTNYANPGCTQLYNYYNNLAAPSLTKGTSQTIQLEFRSTYDAEPRWYAAYIDYNHDNVFDTVSETVIDMTHANVIGLLPTSSGNGLITTTRSNTFTIPTTAMTGVTRMRVVRSHRNYNWNDSTSRVNPCKAWPDVVTATSKWSFGEVEDYDINIIAPMLPPTLSNVAASAVTNNSAVLNGIVNANGYTLPVSFEYGPTTAYGSSVNATPATVSGSANVPVSATVTLLMPNTTYHYRLKTVVNGTPLYSPDTVFKTKVPTEVGNPERSDRMRIYPNPSGGAFNVDIPGAQGEVAVQVWNSTGTLVFSGKAQLTGTRFVIDLAHLPDGIYEVMAGCDGKVYRSSVFLSR